MNHLSSPKYYKYSTKLLKKAQSTIRPSNNQPTNSTMNKMNITFAAIALCCFFLQASADVAQTGEMMMGDDSIAEFGAPVENKWEEPNMMVETAPEMIDDVEAMDEKAAGGKKKAVRKPAAKKGVKKPAAKKPAAKKPAAKKPAAKKPAAKKPAAKKTAAKKGAKKN